MADRPVGAGKLEEVIAVDVLVEPPGRLNLIGRGVVQRVGVAVRVRNTGGQLVVEERPLQARRNVVRIAFIGRADLVDSAAVALVYQRLVLVDRIEEAVPAVIVHAAVVWTIQRGVLLAQVDVRHEDVVHALRVLPLERTDKAVRQLRIEAEAGPEDARIAEILREQVQLTVRDRIEPEVLGGQTVLRIRNERNR